MPNYNHDIGSLEIAPGKKTYITGAAMILAGLAGFLSGDMPSSVAGLYLTNGLAVLFLRMGVAKLRR